RYAPEPRLTFAQLTDAHLFDDDGGNQPWAGAYHLAADNWKALHWSIDRINARASGGTGIDFIVYTGDLGLQNIAFSDPKGCLVKAVRIQPGSPPTPEDSASAELITELDRLTVRTIFFVSGSNDPGNEDPTGGRFDCFLLSLQERAQTLNRPLRIQKLGPDHCFALKGFHLLGLNSASLQQGADDGALCPPRLRTGMFQEALSGSSLPSDLGVLRELVNSGLPTLLFASAPELNRPLRREPAWHLEANIRREWESEARRSNVLGIFAGQFPGSTRTPCGASAGVRELAVNSAVVAKTYLAPPLAIEDQSGNPTTRRGFLLVTATRTGISSSEVQWLGRLR
ncbi:MAG: hypothetical protein ACJ74Y_14525, partial [Bryobacteraceae bacterium]